MLDKYLESELIQTFLSNNNLEKKDILPYIAEIKMYHDNSEKYTLIWDGMLMLETKREDSNPGLIYLEGTVFSNKISLTDIRIENVSKRNALKVLMNSEKGFYLSGNNGIGKTFLAIASANRLYEDTGQKTLYVFWPDFIEKTKRFGSNNYSYINKVKYCKNLIIDDLGQESISPWSRDDILNPIINFRMEKGLRTTVTSNYELKELSDIYTLKSNESKKAKSIANKLKSLCEELSIIGEDLRSKNS